MAKIHANNKGTCLNTFTGPISLSSSGKIIVNKAEIGGRCRNQRGVYRWFRRDGRDGTCETCDLRGTSFGDDRLSWCNWTFDGIVIIIYEKKKICANN